MMVPYSTLLDNIVLRKRVIDQNTKLAQTLNTQTQVGPRRLAEGYPRIKVWSQYFSILVQRRCFGCYLDISHKCEASNQSSQ